MKSIRELALDKAEDIRESYQPKLKWDDYYEPKPQKESTSIHFVFPNSSLTQTTDYLSENYDWIALSDEATEKAYDKMVEMFGKDFESRYHAVYNPIECGMDIEVMVTLTKVN